MDLLEVLLHLANFVAPALCLALVLPLLGRLLMRRQVAWLPWWGQVLLNFVLGVAASVAALAWLGHDGTMLGYGLLVLALGTSQWFMVRGWRRHK